MNLKPVKLISALFTFSFTMATLPTMAETEDADFSAALQDAGWTVEETATGDLILQPAAAGAEPKEDTEAPGPDLETLAQKLEQAGWRAARTPGGDLLLFPPQATEIETMDREESMGALQQRLEAAGWVTRRAEDGSLLVFPAPVAAEPVQEEKKEESTPLSEEELEHLRQAGWKIEEAPDGSLLLFPGKPANAGKEKTEPRTGETMDKLQQQMEEAGWITRRTEDGSLLLFPRSLEPVEPAREQEKLPGIDKQAKQSLRDSGWQIEEAEDGSLLLFPGHRESPAATSAEAEADSMGQLQKRLEEAGSLLLFPVPPQPEAGSNTIEGNLMDESMQERLRAAGWTVQQAADGSLLLFPPGTPADSLVPCPGAKTGASITLPVDSSQEARAVAEKWLKKQPLGDATVERIRDVVRVYVVSIVSSAPPHRLRHQIAIRKRDGSVILVD